MACICCTLPQKNTRGLFVSINFNWVCLDARFLCCSPFCIYMPEVKASSIFMSLHHIQKIFLYAFMILRLPFPIAGSNHKVLAMLSDNWTPLSLSLYETKVYQRLFSQILKYPEDWHHHKASRVCAAPEKVMLCVQSTFITSVEAVGVLLFMQVLWDRDVIKEYSLTSRSVLMKAFFQPEIDFRLNTYASLLGGGGGVAGCFFPSCFLIVFEYFQPNKFPVTFMQSCASFLTVQ